MAESGSAVERPKLWIWKVLQRPGCLKDNFHEHISAEEFVQYTQLEILPVACCPPVHTRNHIALSQQTPRTTAKTPREYSHNTRNDSSFILSNQHLSPFKGAIYKRYNNESNNLKATFEEKYPNWLVEFKSSILVSTRCVYRKQRNKTNTLRMYMK